VLDLHGDQASLVEAREEAEWNAPTFHKTLCQALVKNPVAVTNSTEVLTAIIKSYDSMSPEQLVEASKFYEWGMQYCANLLQQKIGFTNEDRFLKEFFEFKKQI
jgi:hypothetical protein